MTHARIYHLSREAAAARQRAEDARAQGDEAGARYAKAEARRLARILAEG